jgi:hypothetical protein
MTLGCARCHDHKFDPVPARDYYALAGIFASTRTLFNYTDNVARWVELPLPLDADAEAALLAHEATVAGVREEAEAAKTDPALAARAAGERAEALEKQLAELLATGPRRPVAMGVREGDADEIGDTQVRLRGQVAELGPEVPRGFLQVASAPGRATADVAAGESGRRELAEWIASPGNPLTARVFVNRVWHWLFGAGIVRTTDNFGTTGEPPSHPELLDHLATRFVESGWSTKSLVREIVLSRTWQLASGPPPEGDPDNRLLSCHPRRRLDAEQLRDSVLLASGQLDLTVGGPNIDGAGEIDADDTAAQSTEYQYEYGGDRRRSVYTPAFRAKRLDLFDAFDFGNANLPLGERATSTVAPQALYLLNSPFVLAQAEAAARRVLEEAGPGGGARLGLACHLTLGRPPTAAESEVFEAFLTDPPAGSDPVADWTQVVQALFASIDFRYLD